MKSRYILPRNDAVVRQLRLKIIAITMGALLAVVISMLAALNMYMHVTSREQANHLLEFLVENKNHLQGRTGRIPIEINAAALGSPTPQITRSFAFFTASLDERGEVLRMNTLKLIEITDEEAAALIRRAFESGEARGVVGSMQYTIVPEDGGYFAAFVELSVQNELLIRLQRISILVASGSSVVLLALTIILSIWIAKPIERSLQQQKEFISNASHDMKTPLTILSANADVLAKNLGPNKWINTIQNQTQKMSDLVHDLLLLARTSEAKLPIAMEKVDLSQVVLNAALEFESPMFESGKDFALNVEERLSIFGNAPNIERLVNILLDNAIQYSQAHGSIRFTLKSHGNRAQLSVFNTGSGLTREEMSKVFRRFYRSDASRSRQAGGYGLGLSIAQAIVLQHKGKISVAGEYGKNITFSASFRLAEKGVTKAQDEILHG